MNSVPFICPSSWNSRIAVPTSKNESSPSPSVTLFQRSRAMIPAVSLAPSESVSVTPCTTTSLPSPESPTCVSYVRTTSFVSPVPTEIFCSSTPRTDLVSLAKTFSDTFSSTEELPVFSTSTSTRSSSFSTIGSFRIVMFVTLSPSVDTLPGLYAASMSCGIGGTEEV